LIHDIVLNTGELKRGFAPLTKPIPLPLDKGRGIKSLPALARIKEIGLPSKNLRG